MKANELRRNNLILNDKGEIERVFTLYDRGINGYDGNAGIIPLHESEFNPIPLTPELLTEKCGFTKSIQPNGWVFFSIVIGGVKFKMTKHANRDDIYHLFGYDRTIVIDSLSKLQNIVFYLTETELEINL